MVAALSIGPELKRFGREKLPRLAIVAMLLLPLLYGAMYLWAYWNPIGNVDKMPVAIVNADQGVEVDGQIVNAGQQVVDGLLERKDLDWRLMDREQALDGVRGGEYYFGMILPEDFSAAVASPAGDAPRRAVIEVAYNDATNSVGTTIGESAMQRVLGAISDTIGAEAVDKVLIGLQDARSGIAQAADGAGQLADGTGQLRDGTGQLQDGALLLAENLQRAYSGSVELADGAGQLSAGIDRAADGILRLTDGLGQLSGGAQQLGDGAGQLSGGVNQVVAQLDSIATIQADADRALADAVAMLRALPDPLAQAAAQALENARFELEQRGLGAQATGQLNQLRDGAAELAYQLGDPTSTFRAGLAIAASGGAELRDGFTQLKDGGARLSAGNSELSDGLRQLNDGGSQLTDATFQLVDGVGRLDDGANELATRLGEGVEQIPAWDEKQRTEHSTVLGGPVELSSNHMTFAPNFGTGLAPFFISLALFVGGFITWMLLRPLQTRALAVGLSGMRVALASYWPATFLAFGQVLVMFLVVRYAIGLQPVNPVGMFLFLLLISLSFFALTQAIYALFGASTGRIVCLSLLMIQLVSSGGLYPTETTGKLFQILHPFIPMTYTVTGLRQLVIGGADHRLWLSATVLVGLLLGSLAVTAWAARSQHEWSMKRLHPSLQM